nr:LAGLIDADG endonuclease [Taiwanofungus camphoratus]WRO45205.1 LAGLIDADG endonuclease [Taiwanofungus sp. YW-2023a]
MFEALHNHLGIGRINKNRNNVTLVVTSIDEIVSVLIPLFDKHPLHGSKLISYQIFKEVSLMMKAKKHLTVEGTLQILDLAYFMNPGTTLRTNESKEIILNTIRQKYGKLPLISELKLPEINLPEPVNLEFIRGEVDGDGSFNVSFRSDRRRIGVNFTVIHELSELSVLNELQQFFKCGSVYKLKSNAARFQVQTVDDILNNIEPVFRDIKFNTIKQKQYEIFIEVCKLIKTKGYKNDDDLQTIVELAWDMNNSGINRRISKEEYLAKFIKN